MARRNDHTRAELLELTVSAATRIIAEQGYSALTARVVAAEIGYSPGTLYNLFSNLDDLIVHINANTLDDLHSALSKVPHDRNPVTSITALAMAYLHFVDRNDGLWNALFEHKLPPGETLAASYTERIGTLLGVVEGHLAKSLPDVEDAEIGRAARVLWASLHGLCTLAKAGKLGLVTTDSLPGLAETLIVNFLAGLEARASKR